MEHLKSNENPQSVADAMNRLHNLASEHPDPEKDKIAKKLLEQWEKAQEEGNSDEVIRLIGEIEKLYDGTPEGSEKTSDKKDEVLPPAPAKKERKKASRELKENGITIVGPLKGTFDAKEFFRDDNPKVKLYIYDNRVLAMSEKVSGMPESAVSSFDLAKPMNDTEIRAHLPKNHIFTIDDLWMIADLIENKSGALRKNDKNDKANLFYVQAGTSVLVVVVLWEGSEWGVGDWALDGRGQWDDGFRVFSRNG
jgi:hypothetical protein